MRLILSSLLVIDNVAVTILHNTATGEHGGWIQKFTFQAQTTTDQGTFKKERKFDTSRD